MSRVISLAYTDAISLFHIHAPDMCSKVYTFSRKLLRVSTDTTKKQKGRPTIPPELKKICKESYTRKNKEKMNKIYTFYTKLTSDILRKTVEVARNTNNKELETTFIELLMLKESK